MTSLPKFYRSLPGSARRVFGLAGFRPPKSRRRNSNIVWPSGRGHEIGIIHGTLDDVFRLIMDRHKTQRRRFDAFHVNEGDMRALVIEGLAGTPISFVEPPEALQIGQKLAVVVDQNANLRLLHDMLISEMGLPVEFMLDLEVAEA